MKVAESFAIAESPSKVWTFFEDVEGVARCVPGVEQVERVGEDDYTAVVTQAVGPMTATFDLKLKITERREEELLQFTAIGRSVRGAGGNVRATNTVRLSPQDDGAGTAVEVEADLAMGGVLGSLGQKVVAKQVAQVTRQFSAALQERIAGGDPAAATAAAPTRGRRRVVPGSGAGVGSPGAPASAPAAAGAPALVPASPAADLRAPVLALSIVSVVLSGVVAFLAAALVRQTDGRR